MTDDGMDDGDLTSGTQSSIEDQPPSEKSSLKNIGMKKGPKLAKGMKKVSVRNKVANKALKKE